MNVLNHGFQSLFGPSRRLEEALEVPGLAQLRDLQHNFSGADVPVPVAIAVPLHPRSGERAPFAAPVRASSSTSMIPQRPAYRARSLAPKPSAGDAANTSHLIPLPSVTKSAQSADRLDEIRNRDCTRHTASPAHNSHLGAGPDMTRAVLVAQQGQAREIHKAKSVSPTPNGMATRPEWLVSTAQIHAVYQRF